MTVLLAHRVPVVMFCQGDVTYNFVVHCEHQFFRERHVSQSIRALVINRHL